MESPLSILRTENLTKMFGSLIVTNNLNLSIEAEARHAIIGPNGAGKTSLLHQIAGQLRPTSGKIFLKEQEITGFAAERVCRMGLARTFQKNSLFLNLSVVENVRLAVQQKRGNPLNPFTPAENIAKTNERAREVLDQVHLGADIGRLVRELSYGEQRQLEIALALASDPEILLLDEPTSGMSPTETQRMVQLIQELPRQLTIIMIEHDMDVVFSVANRITVLHYGQMLATGSHEEITRNPAVREVYLGVA